MPSREMPFALRSSGTRSLTSPVFVVVLVGLPSLQLLG